MAKRFLAIILSVFVVSLLGCTFLPLGYLLPIAAVAVVLGAVAFFLPVSFNRTLSGALLAITVASAILFLDGRAFEQAQRLFVREEVLINGMVTDLSKTASGDLTCYKVRLEKVGNEPLGKHQHFYVNVYSGNDTLWVGDSFLGTVSLYPEPVAYGSGREERVLRSGYSDEIEGESPSGFSLPKILYNLKIKIRNQIRYGQETTRGLMRSVCFGDKADLDPDLYVSLRRIGLSHVTSVSGFHLSFAVLLFNFLLLFLGVGHRLRYGLDMIVCVLFTAVVGFPLSCVRACVMIVIYSMAMTLNLFSDSLTSLGIAAFFITVLNPQSIRDIGFLLSVSATYGIILLQNRIDVFLFKRVLVSSYFWNRIYRCFTGIFSCSLAATIFTLPIVAVSFKSISVVGPFVNVILIYPLEIIFLLGMMMVLIGWIPPVGAVIGFVGDVLYCLIHGAAVLIGKFPFATVSRFGMFEWIFLSLLLLAVGISVYFFLKYEWRCFWPLLAMVLCFALCVHLARNVAGDEQLVKIAFVDVGQGDCTVISKGHSAVIIDYGGSGDRRYQLIEYLNKQKIFNVELLAFTHLHTDHTNGLYTLEKNCYLENTVYPETETTSKTLKNHLKVMGARVITRDETIRVLDGVTIRVITAPLVENSSDNNENCVCYLVEYGAVSVLLTGDLHGSGELKTLKDIRDISILKVTHHGSNHSSLYPFLKAVSADVAVLSVGDNAYSLPGDETMMRLKSLIPALYITQWDGTVVFETDGEILERKSI